MQPPQETYHDSFLEYPDLDEQSSSPAAYYELTFGEGSQTSSDSAFRDNLQLEGMSFPDPGLNEPLSHNVPSTPFGYVDYTPTLQDARGYSEGANLPERYLQHDPQTSSLADPALAPSRQSSYPSCSPLLVAAPPERLGSVIMFGPPGFFERMLSSFDVNEYNGEDLGILNDDDHPSITQTCSQSGSNSTADTPEGNPKRSFYPRPRNLLLGKVASIYFRTKSGRIGIRAVDALNERYEGLVGKNKVANLGDSRTASAVIEVIVSHLSYVPMSDSPQVPGYKSSKLATGVSPPIIKA